MEILFIIIAVLAIALAILFLRAFRSFIYPADGENGIEIKEKK